MTDTNEQPRPVIGRIEQPTTEPARPAGKEVMQIDAAAHGVYERAVATPPVSSDAGGEQPKCWCETCRPQNFFDMRFIVCPDCGNKRCPKANDHRNACTNSNDVGQPGSSWEHVKPIGEQPAVPLPEPVASRAPNALAEGQWVYREPESFLEKLCRISDAIAYGEACAAHRNAHLAKLCEDRTRMLQQAERERDEQRARAEAAEAKIAEMEGATPQRRA